MGLYVFKDVGQTKDEIIIYLKLEMHNPVTVIKKQLMRTSFAPRVNIACFVKKHYVRS